MKTRPPPACSPSCTLCVSWLKVNIDYSWALLCNPSRCYILQPSHYALYVCVFCSPVLGPRAVRRSRDEGTFTMFAVFVMIVLQARWRCTLHSTSTYYVDDEHLLIRIIAVPCVSLQDNTLLLMVTTAAIIPAQFNHSSIHTSEFSSTGGKRAFKYRIFRTRDFQGYKIETFLA